MTKLAPLIFVMLLSVSAVSAADFYRSNELGMEITPITSAQTANYDWVLSVERRGDAVVRTLSKKGVEVSRWEETYQGGRLLSESHFLEGKLSQTTDYRIGHPVKQTEYTEGKQTLVREYQYSGNNLRSVSVSDGEGRLLYRDLYSEGPDGRLRRAVREEPAGKVSVTSLNYSGDKIISEWLGNAGDGVLFRYSDGQVVSKEEWKGTDLQSEEQVTRRAGGSTSVTKDLSTGVTTKKLFDSEGKIQNEQVEENGLVTQTVDYTYVKGKLETKVTKSPGQREEVRYEYDSEGQLILSRTTVNRQLVKVTHYSGKESYFEDLYLAGQIVLHVFYENGKKVKEVPASSSDSIGDTRGVGG